MPENNRLRIFHVVLSRGFAGSERSTSESCNQQCVMHDVTLIVRADHRKEGASIVDHIDKSVTVIEVPARLFTKRALKKAIIAGQPDIIHCHLRRATRLIAQINPAAATVSTLHISVNGPHFLKMDGIICNARWQLEDMPADYNGLTFKACNSLVPHPKCSPGHISKLRAELGIDPDQYLIGAVGRYHPSKGWDTLINAFRAIDAPEATLLFFGSGSQEEALKALADGDERIRFMGYRNDIKDIYQTFDLMLCPSRFEPLPRVMLEGMDAGVPIIASDEGGCKELIDDYGGQIFPVDDVDALSQVLQQTIALKPAKHAPDLSAHYIQNANAAMVTFYVECIHVKAN